MHAVLSEELRRLEEPIPEPSPEEFVDAVIRAHERIQSKLRLLAWTAEARAHHGEPGRSKRSSPGLSS